MLLNTQQWIKAAAFAITLPMTTSTLADTPSIVKNFKAIYASEFDLGVALKGELTRTLTLQEDNTWLMTNKAETMVASITENSHFSVNDLEVQPHAYDYKRKVLGKSKKEHLTFNWDALSATDQKDREVELTPNTQDKLSYQLQLRLALANGQKGPFEYHIAESGKSKNYTFRIMGSEQVETPMGTYNSLKLELDRGEDSERETFIWFSPDLDYQIVQLKQIEPDGKAYSIQLKSLESLQ
jgi:hypothetical protein